MLYFKHLALHALTEIVRLVDTLSHVCVGKSVE